MRFTADNTARRVPTLGDLEPTAPVVGTIYNTVEGWHWPAHSYNPRRFADSRRKWAFRLQEAMNQIPPALFITTTLPGNAHAQIGCDTIALDSRGNRLFKQRIDRWFRSVVSKHGRCVDCAKRPRACKTHTGQRWRPTGRCGQCGRWRRLEWLASRWVWLCPECFAAPAMPIQKKDRKPGCSMSWVREVGESLDHLHRHQKVTGPYIPQDLLSTWAQDAGLGKGSRYPSRLKPAWRRGESGSLYRQAGKDPAAAKE